MLLYYYKTLLNGKLIMLLLDFYKTMTAIALLASAAAGATISGKVSVPTSAASKGPAGAGYSRGVYRPPVKTFGDTVGQTRKKTANVIVWAEPAGGAAPLRKPQEMPTIIQRNKTFLPHVLVVQSGSTVSFPNLDPLYHNVFSYSRAKRFDLGRYEQGKSKTVTFDEPGVIDVFCEIHENMHAYVLVVDTPWFTRAEPGGAFVLEVPAGTYRVFAWTPDRRSEPVEISLDQDSRKTVEFSF